MSAPRHYYHVTQASELNAVRIVLQPRCGKHTAWDEPRTPRICVAPTPIHCLAALGECLEYGLPIRIYRTAKPEVAQKPEYVEDAKVTKERWLLEPTEFVLEVEVSARKLPEELFRMSTGGRFQIPTQVKMKKTLKGYSSFLVSEQKLIRSRMFPI